MPTISSTVQTTPQIYGNTWNIGEKVPHTVEWLVTGRSPFFTMHPQRWELHDALLTYSFFDDSNLYTTWEFDQILKNRLLFVYPTETTSEFEARIKMSKWSPESRTCIYHILSSVFTGTISRSFCKIGIIQKIKSVILGDQHEGIKDWMSNVDALGTSLTEYMRKAYRNALFYGQSYTLIERGEEDLTPILTNFNALECTNWKIDRRGNLSEVWFVRMFWRDGIRWWRWYKIDETNVSIYEREKMKVGDPILIAEAPHGMDKPPVIVHYGMEREDPMIGTSFLLRTADNDIGKFQADSNIPWIGYQAAHSQIVFYTDEKDIDQEFISSSKVLKCRPGSNEKVEMLQVNSGALEMAFQISKKFKDDIGRAAGSDPMSDHERTDNVQTPSGKARQLSWSLSERREMIRHADRIEQSETDLLRTIYQMFYGEWSTDVVSSYPDDFSLSSPEAVGGTYSAYKEDIPSPTWHKHMLYEIAHASVGNLPEVNAQIKSEIDEAIDAMSVSDEGPMDEDSARELAQSDDDYSIEEMS